MIENRRLKELIKMMIENDLVELGIAAGDESVTLRRRTTPDPPPAPAPVAAALAALPTEVASVESDEDAGLTVVKSPMVGTFYAQSDPESPPYVDIGSEVKPDTVICVVEAMKVFNEIKAECSGTVERVFVESGQAVEFEQKLFLVRPA
ncbi:MAG: acetyl-CoA carboxylase biotin carboxyl carrier protein [Phycisphaerales bacterium]|nr:acetyl-CoA carboxylase biotin carboxyl carrier protein [Phycisphaerales bacterium]